MKNIMTEAKTCPVCSNTMKIFLKTEYRTCEKCRYMMSNFQSGAGAEVEGISSVRSKNFAKIIQHLSAHKILSNSRVLDVGCSSGMFLDAARNAGMIAVGIEPDTEKALLSIKKGFKVLSGFFPEAVPRDERFDVITFNDSFEHIPDLNSIFEGIKMHLNEDGIVIVNLPTSDGFLFYIANLLTKIGRKASFERLWQKGFSSPHVHYFNADNLKQLFANEQFSAIKSFSLLTYDLDGLWRRVASEKNSKIFSGFICCSLIALYPVSVMKSDIVCTMFKLTEKGSTA